MNMPYNAFVATKDIPARVELTLDYDPAAARAHGKKGKGKKTVPKGAKPCHCGELSCRRWVRM